MRIRIGPAQHESRIRARSADALLSSCKLIIIESDQEAKDLCSAPESLNHNSSVPKSISGRSTMERILKFALPPVVSLSESVWYNIGLAVVVVAVLFSAILAYRVYGEVNEDIDPASPEELLAAFEDARFEGELDEEEYQAATASR